MKRVRKRKPRHFLVQHDLTSLKALPNFIWNIVDRTARFDQVSKNDRWIAYAYAKDECEYEQCGLITGIYECVRECRRGLVPLSEEILIDLGMKPDQRAWMIEGREYEEQPTAPVSVPRKKTGLHPIETLIDRRIFRNQAVVPIRAEDFELIHAFALRKRR